MTRVVVSGALANKPGNGGEAWVRMAWVTGLRRLGFEVWFVEQIDRNHAGPSPTRPTRRTLPPLAAVTAGGGMAHLDHGGGPRTTATTRHGAAVAGVPPPVDFFQEVTRRFDLEERCALLDERGERIAGARLDELEQVAAEAALLVNVSGNLRVPSLLERFRRKAYVDLDPGFTQFWYTNGVGGNGLHDHDVFFTVGLNVGRTGCAVPTGDIAWRPLPPPVALEEWPVGEAGSDAFTTIASWRGSFGPVVHDGRTFGLKLHEFRKFIDLPERVSRPLEIALDIHAADGRDLTALREHGWRIVDPRRAVPDPDSYRSYIRASGAEFSVAQGIYVETNSGWFSDRTARYLAAGKPALVQDTGFSEHLPVGEGLLAFRTFDEAVAGAERIAADYAVHCRRARELAEQHLDADLVLARFVDEAGITP